MFKQRISLIPRYNWDYKFSDFVKSYLAILKSNSYSTKTFENLFKQKPVFTTSGRSSLYAILKSLNLPKGSQVGVPLYCCPVVFDAIRQADLVPNFIDIDVEDYNLSVSDLKLKKKGLSALVVVEDYNLSVSDLKLKKKGLSALVVVHMFGHPADMDSISDICGDIPVIEDCAQSLFSQYKGQYTGFLSKVSFFSFRSGKYISAGEGSIIFTKDSLLYNSLSKLIENFNNWSKFQQLFHCASTYIKSLFYKRPLYGIVGYPIGRILDRRLNLTSKAGLKLKKIAIGDLSIIEAKIEKFFIKVNKQRENSLYFLEKIKIKDVFLPCEREDYRSNFYQFPIRFKSVEERDHFADYLFKCGIDSAKYLDDVVEITKEYYDYNGSCPHTEDCSKKVLIIPNHYTLREEDLDYIVNCLYAASNNRF